MDEQHESESHPETDSPAEDKLRTTADAWRESLRGTEAEDAAEEVARGADDAARQPGYGREGS